MGAKLPTKHAGKEMFNLIWHEAGGFAFEKSIVHCHRGQTARSISRRTRRLVVGQLTTVGLRHHDLLPDVLNMSLGFTSNEKFNSDSWGTNRSGQPAPANPEPDRPDVWIKKFTAFQAASVLVSAALASDWPTGPRSRLAAARA